MNKLINFFVLLVVIVFSKNSFADVLIKRANNYIISSEEVSLFQLVKSYSAIIGQNLTIDSDLKDESVIVVGNKIFDEKQMEKYISFQLYTNDMALIRSKKGDYELIEARYIRYKYLPVYQDKDEIPDSHDYVRYIYKLKYIETAELARNVRPFVSRYGRVIDIDSAKQIIISDVAKNVKRIIKIYETLDTPETLANQLELKKLNDKYKSMSDYKEDVWQNIEKYQAYFMILFSLISLLIGFIFRGYLIRRIEGGL
ncbi:MAG: hypothetical protein A2504_09595 [Bdellovibrionales bacterium RIFOXYD12_FULL_39_22]|nr:MAG: hypothetical protein A2385_13085 [Bdellovibrionales bacterium RIFOXYB1_FULL_39_21]OFZ40980.1 MAG: hypothetical protein A2485_16595 [Bdellovibrionales bacterium RIFOXYC12_FULL_39_17]OFZ44808.1 MAG: hypothetical protein A2404_09885 [Bdellovibrionales bacterium RIFOXYC1_FULL_39_130]OFZ74273.1 MAG: hypothetical protein A2560_16850 [Bdellovibrionales bacterium RIFOXYD1_FULL_39_84]OFZ92137.1 MAG: hypothetical protein A2504_09595 [Bdellovibrionales bacterium RIFOXYD12_FULL_39_22]HLE12759.1 hy